ncbi:hypothetical protein [Mycobacterium sp.]|uniref:hypothetical protein n=1 Tax=Mycobacterium sp. TaxID=1785 RepID=UPI003BAA9234
MTSGPTHPSRSTGESWASYRKSIGDRSSLFAALMSGWSPQRALYPGSYLDLSPSTAIPAVTYVDTDRRAARYFANELLVRSELNNRTWPGAGTEVFFVHTDYTTALPLPELSFDLLISLYAGPVWEHCGKYLKPGGLLLANASHGDASIAALDSRLQLAAAVLHRDGRYWFDEATDGYLVPKKPHTADPDTIRQSGRGIPYTRAAFAYLFLRRDPPTADRGVSSGAG